MDDSQCRVCLAVFENNNISVFKRVKGLTIAAKLQFITGVQITKSEPFSKFLCKPCLTDVNRSYVLKTTCIDTDRILKKSLKSELHKVVLQPIKLETLDSKDVVQSTENQLAVVVKTELIEFDYDECLKPKSDEINNDKCETTKQEVIWSREESTETTNKDSLKQCKLCLQSIPAESATLHRYELHYGVKALICDFCGKKVISRGLLLTHLQRHFPTRPNFVCGYCRKKFCAMEKLLKHLKVAHVATQIATAICFCGKSFVSHRRLLQHINYLHMRYENEVICGLCDMVHGSKYQLQYHHKMVHAEGGGNKFMCSVCGRQFHYQNLLRQHMKRHGERTHMCDFQGCDKSFFFSNSLNSHKKIAHLNQKDFNCTFIGCSKSFSDRQRLKRHFLTVHEKVSESCPVGSGCTFAIGRRDYMRNHLKQKHDELSCHELQSYLNIVKEMNLV